MSNRSVNSLFCLFLFSSNFIAFWLVNLQSSLKKNHITIDTPALALPGRQRITSQGLRTAWRYVVDHVIPVGAVNGAFFAAHEILEASSHPQGESDQYMGSVFYEPSEELFYIGSRTEGWSYYDSSSQEFVHVSRPSTDLIRIRNIYKDSSGEINFVPIQQHD